MEISSRARSWVKLIAYGTAFWMVFCVGLPGLLMQTDAWRRFGAAQERWDLHAGSVYYTDVAITRDTESANRQAVRAALDSRLQALEAEVKAQ